MTCVSCTAPHRQEDISDMFALAPESPMCIATVNVEMLSYVWIILVL
jgi:hypothetical protein